MPWNSLDFLQIAKFTAPYLQRPRSTSATKILTISPYIYDFFPRNSEFSKSPYLISDVFIKRSVKNCVWQFFCQLRSCFPHRDRPRHLPQKHQKIALNSTFLPLFHPFRTHPSTIPSIPSSSTLKTTHSSFFPTPVSNFLIEQFIGENHPINPISRTCQILHAVQGPLRTPLHPKL